LTNIIKPEISIVIPVYNSANIFPELHRRIVKSIENCVASFEIIAVLDGCRDNSLEVISSLAGDDKRIKIIELSRNFGHQIAVTAGVNNASGDLVAVIDDDLEDPPELLPDLVSKIKEGYDVVYGVRRKRKRSLFVRFLYHSFYRVLGNLVDVKIPYDAGDFCVMTKRVSSVLVSMKEHNRYLRGLRAWAGFDQTGIEYERELRFADTSGYSLKKYVKLAFDAIFSFSYKPLKYVTLIGIVIGIISLEEVIRIVIIKLTGRMPDIPGWTYLAVAVLFLSSVQLISMGIIGEYLARMYDELKRRPQYVIKNRSGFGEDESDGRD
jgi:dolichol-phosphate mannosyltransferase